MLRARAVGPLAQRPGAAIVAAALTSTLLLMVLTWVPRR